MSEFLANFHFIRPLYLLLLVLPCLYYWRYMKGVDNTSSWEKVCDKNLLCYLLIKGSSGQRRLLYSLFMIGFIAAVIAIAGPAWKKKEVPAMAVESPLMILVNMSSDMMEADITPNRMARTKYKLADFLNALSGVQAGLIVYSDEPFLVTPITNDMKIISNLLPSINIDIMPSNGDRLDRAIDMAINAMRNAKFKSGNIVIFAPDGGIRLDLSIQAAQKAKDLGYEISVIATTKNEVEKLKLVASKVNGYYTNIKLDDSDIRKIADKINDEVSDELKVTENLRGMYEDFGYYLTIIPLLCCLMFFRKGLFVLVFLMTAQPAYAGVFLNNNQQGLKAFNLGDYDKAALKFKDSKWRASALYKKGDFEKAYKEFSKHNDIESVYNQGNALAKSGKIEDAIKKYEEVLEKNPRHADAKFNLKYLKKQQKNNSGGGGRGKNNKDDQKDQNQNQQQQSDDQQKEQNQQQQQQQGQNQQQEQQGQNEQNQNQQGQKQQQQYGEQQKQDEQRQEAGSDENKKEETQQSMKQTAGDEAKENKEKKKGKAKAKAGNETKEKQKYDEQAQAREMQYREIPEDPGGLLRAFIEKEYKRERYGE